MDTQIISQYIVVIIALTGVIKSFIPERYSKVKPLIPLALGVLFSIIGHIDWLTMLVAIITSIGTYEAGKGYNKPEKDYLPDFELE